MNTERIIEKYLVGDPGLDLYALMREIGDVSIHSLLQQITEYGETHGISVDGAFHLRQAETVRQELCQRVPAEDLMAALCHKLSALQTGSIVGKYCNDDSVHAQFSGSADIVMFGDSITEAAPWHEMFTDVSIVSRGIGGDITRGMLARVETVLLAKPKKVFVMAGINDINLGYTLDGILQRYEKIIDAFRKNNIDVLVQSTLYVGERLKSQNKRVESFNQSLRELCRKKHITFVDLAAVLCPEGILPARYSFDDLHLNGAAYEQWRRLIERHVCQS